MKTEQGKINSANTLAELCDNLNKISDDIKGGSDIDQVVDICNLPTFGGVDPLNTKEVWSWDEKHVLVADGSRWSIAARCVCGEADFHCRCEGWTTPRG